MTALSSGAIGAAAGGVSGVLVVKVGGRVQQDAALAPALARAHAARRAAGGALVVVHGGGDEVSALQRAFGATPRFVGGRRVTTAADVDTLRMALSGAANKRLVAALVALGVPAVGLSGEDAALLSARRGDPALGHVGAPAAVNVALLRHLAAGGYLPVVSPLSRDAGAGAEPGALNVNGDDAAAAVASALGADELLLVADVPGVLLGGAAAPTLDRDAATAAIASGEAAGGMAAKLDAALAALAGGVARVRVGDLAALGDPARGTAIVTDPSRQHPHHRQHPQDEQHPHHPTAERRTPPDASLAV